MKRISPSFIGTTIATAIAAMYAYSHITGFHLWTGLVRGVLLGGPIIVLMTYTVTTFIWENFFHIVEQPSSLGKLDYPLRVAAQLFLGLALAALGADIRYYIIAFMIFVLINGFLSWSSRRVLGRFVWVDLCNVAICAAYTWAALQLYNLAAGFEATYPSFITDQGSYDVRVTQLRGEQTNIMLIMAAVVGAMVLNAFQVVSWPWKEQFAKKVAAP